MGKHTGANEGTRKKQKCQLEGPVGASCVRQKSLHIITAKAVHNIAARHRPVRRALCAVRAVDVFSSHIRNKDFLSSQVSTPMGDPTEDWANSPKKDKVVTVKVFLVFKALIY